MGGKIWERACSRREAEVLAAKEMEEGCASRR